MAGKFRALNSTLFSEDVYRVLDNATSKIFIVRLYQTPKNGFLHAADRILMANRDEYLARPSKPASFHSFHHENEWKAISGIDLKGGGTWLGISRSGRIAVL